MTQILIMPPGQTELKIHEAWQDGMSQIGMADRGPI